MIINRPHSIKLATLLWLTTASSIAFANPQDGVVAAGAATINSSGPVMDIHQSTDRAVIDWRGFDIGVGETTNFHQPATSSITVNRVNAANPSQINGTLRANGNLVIINPNGVVFNQGAQVDVNGLVATTADLDNQQFMDGGALKFDTPGNPNATVANHGTITAKDAGLVGLVAPNVVNSGVINARLGRVDLASGDSATLDFYGDGLLEIKASDALQSQLIENTGTINAAGGTIALTAAAGRAQVNSVIKVDGELNAPGIDSQNGKIIIFAEGSNAVKPGDTQGVKTGQSTVLVSGKLNVSNATGTGGSITIAADQIAVLSGAEIDATGRDGGGRITIGGDGHVPDIETDFSQSVFGLEQQVPTPTALYTIIQSDTLINASATGNGHGGLVSVWADDRTEFHGRIDANGEGDGDGGFVETSGRVALLSYGQVNALTRRGRKGTWLLDPADITITAATTANNSGVPSFTPTAAGSQVSAASIIGQLNGGSNVTIMTTNDGFAGNGDIFVDSAITTTGTGALTLSAFRNVTVNNAITLTSGALTLRANNAGAANGSTGAGNIAVNAALTTSGGAITLGGGNGAITAGVGYALGPAGGAGVNIAANVNAGGGAMIINGRGAAAAIDSNFGVQVRNGAVVSSAGGIMTITGIGGGSGVSGFNYGVQVTGTNAAIAATTGANVTVTGTGGMGSTGQNNYGVRVGETGRITASGTGTVLQVVGTGGGSGASASNLGIQVTGTNSAIAATIGADVTIIGNGSTTATGNSQAGISLSAAGRITAEDAGTALRVTGTGGGGGASRFNHGIDITGTSSAIIASNSADVTVIGAGGVGGNDHIGVSAASAGQITATGASTALRVTGTGGGTGTSGFNYGVRVQNTNSRISATDGSLTVTGFGGSPGGTGAGNNGIFSSVANGITTSGSGNLTLKGVRGGQVASSYGIASGTTNAFTTTGTGNITVFADTHSLTTANTINVLGSLTWASYSNQGMSIGTSVASTTNIDSTTLSRINGASYIFGSTTTHDGVTANTGDVSISTVGFGNKPVTFISDNDIFLNGTVTSTATGNAITLAAERNFINSTGSTALSAANGRWLIYSADPAANTRGGLLPDASEFNKTFPGNAPATIGSGNRFIYSRATPYTITYTVIDDSVTYGDAYTVGDLSFTYDSGLLMGDTLGTIGLTGSAGLSTTYVPGITNASGTSYANMITGTTGTLFSALGYAFAFNAADLTVNKRSLTVGLTGTASKVYSGTNAAALASGNYSYTNRYGSDDVTATGMGTYDTVNAGTGKNITVTGLVLGGTAANNYQLASTMASAAIGEITQKDLTVTAADRSVVYGNVVPVSSLSYNGFVLSEDATVLDSAPTINSTASGIVNAGTYTNNYTPVGGSDNNYNLVLVGGNLTVTPRALNVFTNNANKTVGNPNPPFTGGDNLIASDAAQITWNYAPVGFTGNVGSYVIAAVATDLNNRLANYIRINNYGLFDVLPGIVNVPVTPLQMDIPDTVLFGFSVPPAWNIQAGFIAASPTTQATQESDNSMNSKVVGDSSNSFQFDTMKLYEISPELSETLQSI